MTWRTLLPIFTLLALACRLVTNASAAEGGTLKGRFVYGGVAPAAKPLAIVADVAFCGAPKHKAKLVDQSLVVGKDGALANVFFYMEKDPKVALHPFYEAKKKEKVVLNNLGCRFEPHACGLWTAQTLTLTNNDAVPHNTKIDGIAGKSINPLIPPGAEIEEQGFKTDERLPLIVSCSLHNWMKARLLIKNHPYFAISDADGNFEIKHIPAGAYEFHANHESLGNLTNVKIGDKAQEWKKGKVTFKIDEGKITDVGTIVAMPK